jgi:zinc transport system ATP-binding protein
MPLTPQAPALDVRELCVNIADQRVLSDVTFRVMKGEFVGIAGPNGGGKSTFLRAILGLAPTCCGDVRIFGRTREEFQRERSIGYLPQNAAHVEQNFPATAKEVVAMGLTGTRQWPWQRRRASTDAVEKALRATGVDSLAKRRIGEMSGGQRQRVLLAKALVANPDLLILDEPTTGVDPAARDSFAHLLTELNHERDVTILLVSHDADMLHHVATRLIVIDRGLVSDGPPDRVASTLERLHPHEEH